MSIDERARFSKECLIDFLKHKYVPGAKFYRWHTLSNTRRCDDGTIERYYTAVGPRVAQDIINGLHNEEISIDDYTYMYGQYWAECDMYRPAWLEVQNHRKERHTINCSLCKNIRSKDKRKKTRKEARNFKFITIEEFLNIKNNMRKNKT